MLKADREEYFPAGLYIEVAVKTDFQRRIDGVGCLN
jgi:hypothetical protein